MISHVEDTFTHMSRSPVTLVWSPSRYGDTVVIGTDNKAYRGASSDVVSNETAFPTHSRPHRVASILVGKDLVFLVMEDNKVNRYDLDVATRNFTGPLEAVPSGYAEREGDAAGGNRIAAVAWEEVPAPKLVSGKRLLMNRTTHKALPGRFLSIQRQTYRISHLGDSWSRNRCCLDCDRSLLPVTSGYKTTRGKRIIKPEGKWKQCVVRLPIAGSKSGFASGCVLMLGIQPG